MGLAGVTWTELDGSTTLLVPVGSTEQHGPHLPLNTDSRIAEAVARGAVRPGTLLGPVLAYGASGEHESFPGTVSIGQETLRAVLVELGRSACRWAARLALVNGHGGNVPALREAVTLLRAEGRDVAWYGCTVPRGDAHAGHVETSLVLALDPDVVRHEQVNAGNTAPLAELMPAMRAGSVRAVSDTGVLGDPTTATVAEGQRLLAGMVDGLRAALQRWQPGPDGGLA